MENGESRVKRLSESRFNVIISFFRSAGIPFMMKKTSAIYAVYMNIMILCTSSMVLAMFAGVYFRSDDLKNFITNTRALIPIINNVWMYVYCRYVTTPGIIVSASPEFVSPSWHEILNNIRNIKIKVII
jgi:hypothetical protein